MGLGGRVPKTPGRKVQHTASRTLANSGISKLPSVEASKDNKVPKMPKRNGGGKWSVEVTEWWEAIWKSPMSSQWLDSDVKGGINLICQMHQYAHDAKNSGEFMRIMNMIKTQEIRYGLSPLDRLRQNWEITKDSEGKVPEVPAKPAPAPSVRPKTDPRRALE